MIGFCVVLVVLSLVFILPLLWMLVTSFKTGGRSDEPAAELDPRTPSRRQDYRPLARPRRRHR